MCRYPKLDTSDLYKFKMDLFGNGEPEEFLLFVRNFNMTLAASGTLAKSAKVNYSRTLVHGEVLRQFYLLSDDVEGKNPLAVENSSYFFL